MIDVSIGSQRLVSELDKLAAIRGVPEAIRLDNETMVLSLPPPTFNYSASRRTLRSNTFSQVNPFRIASLNASIEAIVTK